MINLEIYIIPDGIKELKSIHYSNPLKNITTDFIQINKSINKIEKGFFNSIS